VVSVELVLPKATRFMGRVLVAEDNPVNAVVIQALLGQLGVEVTHVADGQQALDAIMQGVQSDLVLMDLHMPVLDGYGATQRIRQWETEHVRARLPIIALTADAFEEDHQRCLAVGMDDFLTKPIALSALKAALARHLRSVTESVPPAPIAVIALKPVKHEQLAALINQIMPLLEQHQFDAIARFQEIEDLLTDTTLAVPSQEIGVLLKDCRFDAALQHLRQMAGAGDA
jgi:CheY-like chemotaxis protein